MSLSPLLRVARLVRNASTSSRFVATSPERAVDGGGGGGYRPLAITPLQRVVVGLGSAVLAFVDPTRADAVALAGELSGGPALARAAAAMAASEEGRRVLALRPRVRAADYVSAPGVPGAPGAPGAAPFRAFPAGSFGAAYVAYLAAHGFDPDARPAVRFVADERLAYVAARYREAHDFWHVLFRLPPTVLGETALKAVEARQFGLPAAAAAALVAPARLSAADAAAYRGTLLPWAVRAGGRAAHLLSVMYEERLHAPLDAVREELRVEPAPPWEGE